MHALLTIHPISKISWSAISRKLINQKKTFVVSYIFLHFSTNLWLKFNIPIAVEIQEIFDIWAIGT